MDYTPSQRKFYIAPDSSSRTFEYDSQLEKLPVPELKQSLDKYLKSIQPFVSSHDYENASKACYDFLHSGEGTTLQTLLLNKSKVRC